MGSRGPAPTPTNILKLRGSWRAKLNPNEPQPPPGRPSCPRWLSEEAKRFWRRVVPQLDAMGILTKIDGGALARYCQLYARWREAEEFIARRGSVLPVKNAEGEVIDLKPFPQVGIASKLAEQLLRLEQQFGLTPSARARLTVGRSENTNESNNKARFFGAG